MSQTGCDILMLISCSMTLFSIFPSFYNKKSKFLYFFQIFFVYIVYLSFSKKMGAFMTFITSCPFMLLGYYGFLEYVSNKESNINILLPIHQFCCACFLLFFSETRSKLEITSFAFGSGIFIYPIILGKSLLNPSLYWLMSLWMYEKYAVLWLFLFIQHDTLRNQT